MRRIDTIIVHCADTPSHMDIGADEIRKWHVEGRHWSDIGYHVVIRRSGTCEPGRSMEKAGAHAAGHNKNSIGICLVGGRGKDGQPDANFTAAQWGSLEAVVRTLLDKHALDKENVIGHRDVSSKACPCFDVKAWATGL